MLSSHIYTARAREDAWYLLFRAVAFWLFRWNLIYMRPLHDVLYSNASLVVAARQLADARANVSHAAHIPL